MGARRGIWLARESTGGVAARKSCGGVWVSYGGARDSKRRRETVRR
jgi:hypothetical protein